MSSIKKVAVLGATGNVGKAVVPSLIEAGFNVIVIRRPDSSSQPPTGITVRTADYNSLDSMTDALKGADALVEAFNPAAASAQSTIIDAAVAAGIKHLITPDFSGDTFNPNVHELKIFDPKIAAQKKLEVIANEGKIKWTAIVTSVFYDWAIDLGIFWVDPKKHSITVLGSGNQRVSLSEISICGRAVVAVLSNPEKYANRPAYFCDFAPSTNELVAIIREITAPQEWDIINVPLDGFFAKGMAAYEADTAAGVKDRLNSDAYRMVGTYSCFEETNRYGADFHAKNEDGFGMSLEEFKASLKKILA
ncbi:hypothetical protein F5884DRAFT_778120 [Xylogone sp. PMI_703]|nr:hypothetical protein F5884DRAFT_778120 [Xylogone sp. PMI_703]